MGAIKGTVEAEERPVSANYGEENLGKHRSTTLPSGMSCSREAQWQLPGTPVVTVSLGKPLLTTSTTGTAIYSTASFQTWRYPLRQMFYP